MAAKKTQHRVFCNSACTANQTNILLYCTVKNAGLKKPQPGLPGVFCMYNRYNQTNILLYCKKYMTRKTLEFFQPRKLKCNLPSTGFDPGKYFILNKCQKNMEKKLFRSKINYSISDNSITVLTY